MKLKDLINVIDNNVYLSVVTETSQWLYDGKVIFIASDLLERTVKLIDIIRDEFFIVVED